MHLYRLWIKKKK